MLSWRLYQSHNGQKARAELLCMKNCDIQQKKRNKKKGKTHQSHWSRASLGGSGTNSTELPATSASGSKCSCWAACPGAFLSPEGLFGCNVSPSLSLLLLAVSESPASGSINLRGCMSHAL